MWIIRWFFIALILFIAILFVVKNQGLQPISIDFVFYKTEEISPLTALFFSFITGFLTWFVISLFNFMKMRSDMLSKDKTIKNLKNELNEYRNASLKEDDITTDDNEKNENKIENKTEKNEENK